MYWLFFFCLFGFAVLASFFYCCLGFFVLHGWMSHNGSPKVKMGDVELVTVETTDS